MRCKNSDFSDTFIQIIWKTSCPRDKRLYLRHISARPCVTRRLAPCLIVFTGTCVWNDINILFKLVICWESEKVIGSKSRIISVHLNCNHGEQKFLQLRSQSLKKKKKDCLPRSLQGHWRMYLVLQKLPTLHTAPATCGHFSGVKTEDPLWCLVPFAFALDPHQPCTMNLFVC